ncbi:predicted protein [Sclerotinia sclerotiorum 1980 UF-70]|uniref:SRR1-like domain-containing protein n=1 Tax=Sclerotinia sclerotiorum (strain ATCC 18683 / 1980 / Ss-1) TaxID=665079 RepID=A7F924_SCLS1|nr:predicted protein [Sclerotinia sclerotiorum 1980 UF-70]EDN99245.1 predicted protein [Sclerotinia sclerotiorum 1980 UF-70]
METETDEGTPTTSPTDAPFIPPAGVCDVGDIVRHGKDELMVLGSDQKWHEGEGPSDFEVKFSKYEKADLFRKSVQHEDEEALKETFEEYLEATKTGKVIQHEDVKMLKELLETMRPGKVMPTNVAHFASGSFHLCGNRRRPFEQLAVLMKFMELLEIPPNARKVMQDPEFSPGDARFLAKLGFQTVMDPEGIDAVNEKTFVFQIGGELWQSEKPMTTKKFLRLAA